VALMAAAIGKKLYITFTFRAFGRRFYPKQFRKSTCVEGDSNISLWHINIRIEQVSSIHSCKANRTQQTHKVLEREGGGVFAESR